MAKEGIIILRDAQSLDGVPTGSSNGCSFDDMCGCDICRYDGGGCGCDD